MTTTFDATITVTPSTLAGTPLLLRPGMAVKAIRKAVEGMSGAAWIDVTFTNIRGEWPLIDRLVVRGAADEAHEGALQEVVEMVARRALEVYADRVRNEAVPRVVDATPRGEVVDFVAQRLALRSSP